MHLASPHHIFLWMGDKNAQFDPAQAFWDYSFTFYTSEGMEPLLLSFQEEAGLDVNLLLLCCWTGRHGVRLDSATLARLEQHAGAWRDVAIRPIRTLRERLKLDVGGMSAADAASFRDKVKSLELEAEREEQRLLIRLLDSVYAKDGRDADRAGLVRANLVRYIASNSPKTLETRKDVLEKLIARSVEIKR